MLLAEVIHIQVPGMSAKWVIGSIALFHTAVASLAIGFAFVVTCLQIVGYRRKVYAYDLLAKRIQLWHVCVYNIGTINAIGLVFALGGLYPQFWTQLFVHMFWPFMLEEFCFFLLATTLTLHYFFWDYLVAHKKLQIAIGALLTPLFFLQFYLINGMGGFMLTPGAGEGTVSQWSGTMNYTGYDFDAFYNPSFLMLTFHRTSANISYGGFFAAGVCGAMLALTKREKLVKFWEAGGRMVFHIAFIFLLTLPIIGFFYAWVLKYYANEAYNNLMFGRGDVVAGGIDWWWLKHMIVVAMIGLGLSFYWQTNKQKQEQGSESSRIVSVLVYGIGSLYILFYACMAIQMTWFFFWMMLAGGVGGAMVGNVLFRYHKGSARGVFVLIGILSFFTVMLGGYVREASRPRFVNKDGVWVPGPQGDAVNRYSHYDNVYLPAERQKAGNGNINMVLTMPAGVPTRWDRPIVGTIVDLITEKCIGCHTLDRVRKYKGDDWERVMWRMRAYGTELTAEQVRDFSQHFRQKKPY